VEKVSESESEMSVCMSDFGVDRKWLECEGQHRVATIVFAGCVMN